MKIEYDDGQLFIIPETDFEIHFLKENYKKEKKCTVKWFEDDKSSMGIYIRELDKQ